MSKQNQTKTVPLTKDEYLAEYNVKVAGEAAVDWFRRQNTVVRAAKDFEVRADRIRARDFDLVRMWHVQAHLDDMPTVTPARWRAIIQLEGRSQLTSLHDDLISIPLKAGSVVMLPAGRTWRLSSFEPTARIVVRLDVPFHGEPADSSRPYQPTPGANSDAYRKVLISTVNAVLSSDGLRPNDPRITSVRMAITHLLAANVASDLLAESEPSTRGEDAIYYRALARIATRSLDEAFTVAALAEELQLSRQYLNRTFARRGTTPLQEIRAVRIAAARNKLAATNVRTHEVTARIAQISGFSSTRSMHTALRLSALSPR